MDDETKARIDQLIAAQESLVLVLADLAEAISRLAESTADDDPGDPFGSLDD